MFRLPWPRRDIDAERLARALDDTDADHDPETQQRIDVARALAPGVHPREDWHAALKDRVLREAAGDAGGQHDGPGSLDGIVEPPHVRHIDDATLGGIDLSDLEPITDDRVAEVLNRLHTRNP